MSVEQQQLVDSRRERFSQRSAGDESSKLMFTLRQGTLRRMFLQSSH